MDCNWIYVGVIMGYLHFHHFITVKFSYKHMRFTDMYPMKFPLSFHGSVSTPTEIKFLQNLSREIKEKKYAKETHTSHFEYSSSKQMIILSQKTKLKSKTND